MATTDINGMVFYAGTDPVAPLHTNMNAISTAVTNALNSETRTFRVANQAGRDALLVARGASASAPLQVDRADTKTIERTIGTGWRSSTTTTRVPDQAARDALLAEMGASLAAPLQVDRADTGLTERNTGSGWVTITPSDLTWTPITLNTGITNTSGFPAFAYRLEPGGQIHFRGTRLTYTAGITVGAGADYTLASGANALPVAARPAGIGRYATIHSYAPGNIPILARFSLNNDGSITWRATAAYAATLVEFADLTMQLTPVV